MLLELADALAPYLGAASSREALAQITRREPLHRFGGTAPGVVPAIARERWACQVRDAVRAHLRAGDHNIPDEDGLFSLLSHPDQAPLRAALGIVEAPASVRAAASARSLTISNLRTFLEYPVQAWAQAVLGLDEVPDDDTALHSDEPFHLDRAQRAMLLRDVFAAHLRDPSAALEQVYDRSVSDAQLRGQFPVGVFAEAARAVDLATLGTWRSRLGPISVDGVVRYGFGRATVAGAQLLPALAFDLPGGRTVRLTGQTELLVKSGDRYTSTVVLLRELDKKSAYHLRGAFDHVLLAAAGIATHGHAHKLFDPKGNVSETDHKPWTQADARGYLTGLIGDLLDGVHGYLLPFEALVRALNGGKPSYRTTGDQRNVLGYGPIERADGLEAPPDAQAIALRRFGPLVERMVGGHGFEGKS
ncbi:hypothetical protein BH11MYX3_BH11MYX3_16610 [soil metagenome]